MKKKIQGGGFIGGCLIVAATCLSACSLFQRKDYSKENATLVSTPEDLLQFADGGVYSLTGDIDFEGQKWRCLDITDDLVVYGNGYCIKNVVIENNDGGSSFGMFTVSHYNDSSMPVEFHQLGLVDFTMDVDYNNSSGVFVGPFIAYSGTFTRQENVGYAPGFFGSEFYECYAKGVINANVYNSMHIGGFAGYATGGHIFENCLSDVEINAVVQYDDSSREVTVGGFIGKSSNYTCFDYSISTASITVSEQSLLNVRFPSLSIGGFAGKTSLYYYAVENEFLSAPKRIVMDSALAEGAEYDLSAFFGNINTTTAFPAYYCSYSNPEISAKIDECDSIINDENASSDERSEARALKEEYLDEIEADSCYYSPSPDMIYGYGLNIKRSAFFSNEIYTGDYSGEDENGDVFDVFMTIDEEMWRFDGEPHLVCFETTQD